MTKVIVGNLYQNWAYYSLINAVKYEKNTLIIQIVGDMLGIITYKKPQLSRY